MCQVWWYRLVILQCWRLRQDGCEFKASLSYSLSKTSTIAGPRLDIHSPFAPMEESDSKIKTEFGQLQKARADIFIKSVLKLLSFLNFEFVSQYFLSTNK